VTTAHRECEVLASALVSVWVRVPKQNQLRSERAGSGLLSEESEILTRANETFGFAYPKSVARENQYMPPIGSVTNHKD
jgi:hypothetical protein